MTQTVLEQPTRQQLIDFCWRHHIRKLALFGSALREDFSAASDLDTPQFLSPHFRDEVLAQAEVVYERA